MNPFALHGPAFLAFYAAVGIFALVLQYVWSRANEAGAPPPKLKLTDPYQIATLRSGQGEALRVAAVALMDRKLLTANGRMLSAEPGAEEKVDNPVELAVLQLYREPRKADAMDANATAASVFEGYRAEFQREGLLANARIFGLRLIPFCVCALLVIGVGALKLFIALSEGRHNVGYLILMMLVFPLLSLMMFRKRGTRAGAAMVSDLETVFRELRGRADALPPGTASSELAMLAAVFGIAAISETRFPAIYALQPEPSTNNSSSWNNNSWSSSSSSSSSSGSSGGSSRGSGSGCGG